MSGARLRAVFLGAAAAVIVAVGGCGSSGYQAGDTDYATSTSAHMSNGSRAVLALSQKSPVPLVEGHFTEVVSDRAWVNLPEDEIKDGIDSRQVEFDAKDASFRTLTASLEVSGVIAAGKEGAPWKAGDVVKLTLVLFNDSSIDAARDTLTGLGRVVVPLASVQRGAFGNIVEPSGGGDIILSVGDNGELLMPLADEAIQARVLGSIKVYDDLIRAQTPASGS